MGSFTIDGIALEIPDECLSDPIIHAIETGKYEGTESRAMKRHLVPTDRMVDLGAGAGYLCSLAAKVVGGENVLGVEANPVMAPAARANLRRNGGGAGRVLHSAVVPDDFAGDSVRFLARKAFWSGFVDRNASEDHPRHVDVPVLRIGDIMADLKPTLVMMDIEGAEADLAGYAWPDHVRMVIFEVHTRSYPPAALHAIFTGFFDNGFTYCPWGSRGETLVFERPLELPG